MKSQKTIINRHSSVQSQSFVEVAIYARRSTEDSKKDRADRELHIESTIKTQTQSALALAQQRGFHVSKDSIFQEYFTGAELWDRPVLTELRTRIRNGSYKALICHSTDRLSREPIHLAIIADECDRAGCELIFVTEPLDTSPEAALIRYIKGYAAKIEREKFKERTKRQRAEILGAGRMICAGAAKYGYFWDREKRCRVRDEQTARIVYDIFKWTIQGMSGRVIADKLQAARVPSPSKRQGRQYKDARAEPLWNNTMISRILSDETYTGKTFANLYRTTDVRRKNGKLKTELAPRDSWLQLPDGVTPPLITTEMFMTARAVIEQNKKRANYKRNSGRPYLLRGMIFCEICRNPMYPEADQVRVMRNRVRSLVSHSGIYRCSHGRQKVNRLNPDIKCAGGRVRATDIEQVIWNRVVSFFNDPSLIADEVEKVLSDIPDDNLRVDLHNTESELEKIQRVRTKMLTRWQEAVAERDDDLAQQFNAEIKRYGDSIKAYKSVISDLQSRIAAYDNITQTVNNFQEYCALVCEGMSGEFTFEEKVAALRALKVKVFAAKGHNTRIQLNTGVLLQTNLDSVPLPAAQ